MSFRGERTRHGTGTAAVTSIVPVAIAQLFSSSISGTPPRSRRRPAACSSSRASCQLKTLTVPFTAVGLGRVEGGHRRVPLQIFAHPGRIDEEEPQRRLARRARALIGDDDLHGDHAAEGDLDRLRVFQRGRRDHQVRPRRHAHRLGRGHAIVVLVLLGQGLLGVGARLQVVGAGNGLVSNGHGVLLGERVSRIDGGENRLTLEVELADPSVATT